MHKTAPYTELIKLDHNENPLGASPLAIAAAKKALSACHRYPDGEESILKASLASHLGVLSQTITLGNGSESLLELIAKTYLTSKNSAVLPKYSFTGIAKIIKNTGAQLRIVTNTYECTTASEILLAINASTKIIFIVNPNNPTGTYINNHELSYLLNKLPTDMLILIDEAYAEYIEIPDYPNTIKLISNHPNLIISRTFSKFYGLAGLRLGYMISHPQIASNLQRNRLPFTINSIALAASQAALCDHQHAKLSRVVNREGRSQLSQGLKKLSLTVLPSYTNFVCVDLKQRSLPLYKQLLKNRIKVRPLYDYGMPNHLRISIGLEEQNQCLLEALDKILYSKQLGRQGEAKGKHLKMRSRIFKCNGYISK
ncbi:MAG: histidinol-phosphate transaminase [Pseudomonadota bacterium]